VSARSRKKEHYCRILGRSKLVQSHGRSAKKCYIRAWRVIKRDVMRLFGNNRAMAWEWFISPAMALDNKSPMDLVVEGNLNLVREYLIRLEYGVYM